MTLLECYQECFKIWDGLAKNGNGKKPITRFDSDCPCCHYVNNTLDTNNCENCPLIDLWGGYEDILDYEPCKDNNISPYELWICTRFNFNHSEKQKKEDRKCYAKQIADFCQKKIKELTK